VLFESSVDTVSFYNPFVKKMCFSVAGKTPTPPSVLITKGIELVASYQLDSNSNWSEIIIRN